MHPEAHHHAAARSLTRGDPLAALNAVAADEFGHVRAPLDRALGLFSRDEHALLAAGLDGDGRLWCVGSSGGGTRAVRLG